MDWIVAAMRRAFRSCQDLDLDVRIVTYAGKGARISRPHTWQALREHSCCSWRRNSNEKSGRQAVVSDLFGAPKVLLAMAGQPLSVLHLVPDSRLVRVAV